ncbi:MULTISPECIES: hypothetical protein [unclassified Methylosinus]|uniref:hypothetical protein n=1 Tax=unclassified Methylosinus TaxID=2624500 RepID=UPI0012EE811F|nr:MULTISPECIES: hypothetical protein [unclassified Methylosinus]
MDNAECDALAYSREIASIKGTSKRFSTGSSSLVRDEIQTGTTSGRVWQRDCTLPNATFAPVVRRFRRTPRRGSLHGLELIHRRVFVLEGARASSSRREENAVRSRHAPRRLAKGLQALE